MFKYMNLHKLHGQEFRAPAGGEGGGEGGGAGGEGGGGGGADDDPAAQIAKMQQQLQQQQAAYDESQAELERFRNKHAEAEKHRKEQEKAAQAAAEEAARKSGDVDAIEKSWGEKYTNRENELVGQLGERDAIIQSITVGAEAKSLAAELAIDGSAAVLMPHIESRLAMDVRDGKPVMKDGRPVLKVLKDGKPSAMTLDDLRAEIEGMPAFAPILKGSKASGGGGAGEGAGGGAKTMKRSAYDALTPPEQAAFIRSGGRPVD